MPNKLSQFWKELRRRRVHRLLAIYAGSAYVIFEASTLMFPRWGLPDWTIDLMFYLLVIGAIVTIILGWIYDLTPEGIKKTEALEHLSDQASAPGGRRIKPSDIVIAALLIVVCVLVYPRIFRADPFKNIRDEEGRITVVVMPFTNLTGDSLYNIWQEGLQNLLITSLANSEELSVRQAGSMASILRNRTGANYASFTPTIASEVAQKLEASTVIIGHMHKSGKKLRITANIMDARNEEIYKSYEVDGSVEEDFFLVTDSISLLIQRFLEIKSLQKNLTFDLTNVYTSSPDAYKLYIQGHNCIGRLDYRCGIDCLSEALAIDSNFVTAMRSLAYAYGDIGQAEKCKQWAYKAYKNLDRVPRDVQLTIKEVRATVDKQPYDLINYTRQYLELYPNSLDKQYTLGWAYNNTEQWQNAITALQKSVEVANNSEMTAWIWTYLLLAQSYHEIGEHEKEKSVLEEGIRRIPRELAQLNYWQAICAVSLGDSLKARVHIENIRDYGVENNWPESTIINWQARIYTLAKVPEKAEELHRQALAMDPNNPELMNDLASFLISNDKDMEEAMKLIEHALEKAPENPDYLFTYGRVLNKTGLATESLRVLKKSWDLRPYYEHDHYLLLTELEESLLN